MKNTGIWAAVCCLFLVMGLAGCCGKEVQAVQDTLRYRFASQEEGRRLKMAGTDYFDSLTQNDLDWKLQRSGQTLEEFKAVAAEQILEYTDEEKRALGKVMNFIGARMGELGIRLPADQEIVFVKSQMGDEGFMGGYTLGNVIYFSADETEYLARAFQEDPGFDADYQEYVMHFERALVAHEIFHCLTRNNPQFRRQMYSLIGFTVMDREVELGPTVRALLLHNPDVEHYDNWAEFTIGGQKRRCALLSVYPGTYAEAAAIDPNAHFFNKMRSVLVPLDDPDTMIPVEEATDFYEVVGHNTDYVCAPEECLADNFSYLIAYGFFGRYDLGEDRKVIFIPYESPRLIRDIHRTLLAY